MGGNFQNNIVIHQGADLEICLDTSYNNYGSVYLPRHGVYKKTKPLI